MRQLLPLSWWRRLVNAYEGESGCGVFTVKKLCHPHLSALAVMHFIWGATQMFRLFLYISTIYTSIHNSNHSRPILYYHTDLVMSLDLPVHVLTPVLLPLPRQQCLSGSTSQSLVNTTEISNSPFWLASVNIFILAPMQYWSTPRWAAERYKSHYSYQHCTLLQSAHSAQEYAQSLPSAFVTFAHLRSQRKQINKRPERPSLKTTSPE